MSDSRARRFLLDALDLIGTYLHGESVALGEVPVGASDERSDPGLSAFLAELEARHAIACGSRLSSVITAIEAHVSSTTVHQREESLSAIRGQLDVPRYLARRTRNVSLPRSYPVQTLRRIPETPENALAILAIEGVTRQLAFAPFPIRTAEGAAAASGFALLRSGLRRKPWTAVRRRDSPERLIREVESRVARRQTGNDNAYQALIAWYDEWLVHPSRLGESEVAQVADGLLAFPPSEAFWERVFEIWCLREIAAALGRRGFTSAEGPRSLRERGKGPIYVMTCGSAVAEIWFQRQKPVGDPRWRYLGGGPLTGIPDLVVTMEERSPLVVDAKYRSMRTDTRSEETYKMLGYAENFRETATATGFEGLLLFPGSKSRVTELTGPEDGHLSLVAVEPEAERAEAEAALDGVIASWLKA